MKAMLLGISIALFLVWVMIVSVSTAFYGIAGNKTRAKYERNISLYKPCVNDEGVWFYIWSDTLGCVWKNAFFEVNPFYKWHIQRVGTIPRSCRLSRTLDSLEIVYDRSYTNPYK